MPDDADKPPKAGPTLGTLAAPTAKATSSSDGAPPATEPAAQPKTDFSAYSDDELWDAAMAGDPGAAAAFSAYADRPRPPAFSLHSVWATPEMDPAAQEHIDLASCTDDDLEELIGRGSTRALHELTERGERRRRKGKGGKRRPEDWEYWPSLTTELSFTCGAERSWKASVVVYYNWISYFEDHWTAAVNAKVTQITRPDGKRLTTKQFSSRKDGHQNRQQLDSGLGTVTGFFLKHLDEKMPGVLLTIVKEHQAAGTMKVKPSLKVLGQLLQEIRWAWDPPRALRERFPPNFLLRARISDLLRLPDVLPFELDLKDKPQADTHDPPRTPISTEQLRQRVKLVNSGSEPTQAAIRKRIQELSKPRVSPLTPRQQQMAAEHSRQTPAQRRQQLEQIRRAESKDDEDDQ
ncbi:MAG: hypothetical protein HYZ28_18655 [Myxococcales bacterium]|nr:hypothetical protein [Myxococcales bacterium]